MRRACASRQRPRNQRGGGLGGAAAANAGVGGAVFVEELAEALEHDAAELLGVDDRDGTAVIPTHP